MGEGGVEMDAPTIIASLGLETAAPIIASVRLKSRTTPRKPRIMKDIFKRDSSRADDGRTCRATTQAFMPRRAYLYRV